MRGDTRSLLPEERCWSYRRREQGRLWWFLLSLLLHAVLLFFAGGWIEPACLRPEGPFIVSLVPPETVSPAPERELPEAEADTAPVEAPPAGQPESPVETTAGPQGTPEAPELEPTPQLSESAPLTEPVPGDSLASEVGPPGRERLDVAGETARRLLARLDTLPPLPAAARPTSRRPAVSESLRGVRPGAEAGITGPLGRRGLLYLEHPAYPVWAEEEGVAAAVRFRFWVSPAGHVTRMGVLTKSGYPEFESLARSAVARWRFEPLPPGEEREEWGEVRIVWGFPQAATGPRWER